VAHTTTATHSVVGPHATYKIRYCISQLKGSSDFIEQIYQERPMQTIHCIGSLPSILALYIKLILLKCSFCIHLKKEKQGLNKILAIKKYQSTVGNLKQTIIYSLLIVLHTKRYHHKYSSLLAKFLSGQSCRIITRSTILC